MVMFKCGDVVLNCIQRRLRCLKLYRLCKQLNAKYLIADDKEARRASKTLNITPIGTCSTIIRAYKQKSITKNEAHTTLNELLKVGFRIEPELYQRILHELEPKR
ncbi:DUF3368 domain-containing protein [Candidatus Bathyarchaeota archaeon]|nr:DUF3368 domain-containing protein [Candidatus Bathyarchaeota archaeon]